jgi:adenylate cyclase class 2
MQIEYEATFENIDKDEMRERLKAAGARLTRPEFLQKRVNFDLPNESNLDGAWIRVRDEGDKTTLTLKIVDGGRIENQKEIIFEIKDFDKAVEFFEKIGCRKKAYQETKREAWILEDTEIFIDEWPFLKPFVEIEGKNEGDVRKISEKLGFQWNRALFCAVGHLYCRKYNMPENYFNEKVPKITFEMKNPFLKFDKK